MREESQGWGGRGRQAWLAGWLAGWLRRTDGLTNGEGEAAVRRTREEEKWAASQSEIPIQSQFSLLLSRFPKRKERRRRRVLGSKSSCKCVLDCCQEEAAFGCGLTRQELKWQQAGLCTEKKTKKNPKSVLGEQALQQCKRRSISKRADWSDLWPFQTSQNVLAR